MSIDRRHVLGALPALAVLGSAGAAAAADRPELRAAVARFVALDGDKSFRIDVGEHGEVFRQAYKAAQPMFIGSAIKTFILVRYLKDVEAGRLTLDQLYTVDDAVRSLSSPVLEELTGRLPARSVLEAMIAHSDNTATDIAMKAVGADRVRRLIQAEGLTSVLIPDSTRALFFYLAGAPKGVDKGWAGMQRIAAGGMFGTPRSPLNNVVTMMGNANDLVTHYQRALRGDFFSTPAMLTEFRRIQAQATAIYSVVPPDIAAYAKGGSIDWQGVHALCIPGQMILGRAGKQKLPVTFSFTYNWRASDADAPKGYQAMVAAMKGVLAEVTKAFG